MFADSTISDLIPAAIFVSIVACIFIVGLVFVTKWISKQIMRLIDRLRRR
jgi:hypothetical protein